MGVNTQEALKLALEFIEANTYGGDDVAQLMTSIREALAEQPAQGCEFCSHPLYAGTKCKNCGREQPAIKQDLTPEQPAQQQAYEQANPLGGPAKVFQAMANAIRAGDSYHAVLRQYGYAEAAQQQEPVAEVRQDMTKACPFCPAEPYHLCGHFTSPPASKPLTMQERTSIVRANKSFHDKDEIDAYGIIDDVEAAHGIKGDA